MSGEKEKSIATRQGDETNEDKKSPLKKSQKNELQNFSKIWYISLIILSSICLLGILSIYFLVLITPSDVELIVKKAGLTVTIIGGSGLFLVVLRLYLKAYSQIVKLLLTIMASYAILFSSTSIVTLSNYIKGEKVLQRKGEMFKGYAELAAGDLDAAEKTFQTLSQSKGRDEVLAKEGLVSVYVNKGQTDKALELAKEVEKKAPDRAYVHVVKGDFYNSEGKKQEAQAEYQKAAHKKSASMFKKAIALNKLGRLQASGGNLSQAEKLFNQAVEIDPYYIEATSNKGMTYEKENKWNKALDAYRQALALNKDDVSVAALAKNDQSMVALQNDVARKKRMDEIFKNIAERYGRQKQKSEKLEDDWTSRELTLTFLNFQEKGILVEREGISSFIVANLIQQLNASGRVRVIESVLYQRVLEELNYGSSDLVNQETVRKLGQLLTAKIIIAGELWYLPKISLLTMRMIDTETLDIPKVIITQIESSDQLEKEVNSLNREILKAIIQKYPLRGYIVQEDEKRVTLNLGAKQGVVLGTKFEVLKEHEPIEFRGRKMSSGAKSIAALEVTQVEPDICYARVISSESSIHRSDKVREFIKF